MTKITLSIILLLSAMVSLYAQSGGLRVDWNSSFSAGGFNNVQLVLFEQDDTDFSRLRLSNSSYNGSTNNRFWDIAATIGNSDSQDLLNFYSRGLGADILSIRGDGRVGIRTTSPSAELEVNGYTKLGSDAPKIKMKKLTGTTIDEAAELVNTGLGDVTILAVDIHIEVTPGTWIPPFIDEIEPEWNYVYTIRYIEGQSYVNIGAKGFSVELKPYRILITYEE